MPGPEQLLGAFSLFLLVSAGGIGLQSFKPLLWWLPGLTFMIFLSCSM
jgi:hypothetical protein